MAAEIVEGTDNPLPADGKTKACCAGGGIKTGRIIGLTDARGERAFDRLIHAEVTFGRSYKNVLTIVNTRPMVG